MPAQNVLVDHGIAPPPGAAILGNVAYIPPGLEGYYKTPFFYNIIFNAIGAGAVQTGTANINNDSYFVCTQMTVDIWDSATGNTTNTQPNVAPMLVRILDTSSGKYMMDQATPLANVLGTAQQPGIWLYRGALFFPGGQIQLELTNGMAASQRVRFTFAGFKTYSVPDSLEKM